MSAVALKERLRADLKGAMREKRADEVALLRKLIAALDNAEAVPTEGYRPRALNDSRGDVTRRQLNDSEIDTLLADEIAERRAAADEFDRRGLPGEAVRLAREAELIGRYRSNPNAR